MHSNVLEETARASERVYVTTNGLRCGTQHTQLLWNVLGNHRRHAASWRSTFTAATKAAVAESHAAYYAIHIQFPARLLWMKTGGPNGLYYPWASANLFCVKGLFDLLPLAEGADGWEGGEGDVDE